MRNRCRVTLCVLASVGMFTASSQIIAATETGIASVYSGEKTANGEYAHAHGLTAAHKTLPFGTRVKVTNMHNGRSVIVRINDRGPYTKGHRPCASRRARNRVVRARAGRTHGARQQRELTGTRQEHAIDRSRNSQLSAPTGSRRQRFKWITTFRSPASRYHRRHD